jgi:trans-aconitate 2-methyltransferase
VSPDWDADTYHRVALPQLEWARRLLDRMPLRGDERVLDAGCGSGKVTAMLAERVPAGHVVAVDASPDMAARAREEAGPNVEVHQADLLELEVEEPVDVIFSAAVFHWIPDHDALFANLRRQLRPGGWLAAHCGGRGNVDGFLATVSGVADREPYRPFFAGWQGPWNFAAPEDTEARLTAAGFADAHCWLEPAPTPLVEPATFLRTICCGDHLAQLPEHLHGQFVDDVVVALEPQLVIDYVRLQIDARAGG